MTEELNKIAAAPMGPRKCKAINCTTDLDEFDSHLKCMLHRRCISRSTLSFRPIGCKECDNIVDEVQFLAKVTDVITIWRELNGWFGEESIQHPLKSLLYNTPFLSNDDIAREKKKRQRVDSDHDQDCSFTPPPSSKKSRRTKEEDPVVGTLTQKLIKDSFWVMLNESGLLDLKQQQQQQQMTTEPEEPEPYGPSTSDEQQFYEDEYESQLYDPSQLLVDQTKLFNEEQSDEECEPDNEWKLQESDDSEEETGKKPKKDFKLCKVELPERGEPPTTLKNAWPAIQAILGEWNKVTMKKKDKEDWSLQVTEGTLDLIKQGLRKHSDRINRSSRKMMFGNTTPPLNLTQLYVWSGKNVRLQKFLAAPTLERIPSEHVPYLEGPKEPLMTEAEAAIEASFRSLLKNGIVIKEIVTGLKPFMVDMATNGETKETIKSACRLLSALTDNVVAGASAAVGQLRANFKKNLTDRLNYASAKHAFKEADLMAEKLIPKTIVQKQRTELQQKVLRTSKWSNEGMTRGSFQHQSQTRRPARAGRFFPQRARGRFLPAPFPTAKYQDSRFQNMRNQNTRFQNTRDPEQSFRGAYTRGREQTRGSSRSTGRGRAKTPRY